MAESLISPIIDFCHVKVFIVQIKVTVANLEINETKKAKRPGLSYLRFIKR